MLVGSRMMGLGSCVAEGCTSVTDMGANIGDCSSLLGQAFNPKCWFGPTASAPSPVTISDSSIKFGQFGVNPENYGDQGPNIVSDASIMTPLIDMSGFNIPSFGISGNKVFLVLVGLGLVLFLRR